MTKELCQQLFNKFIENGDLTKVLESHNVSYDDWLKVYEEMYPPECEVEYRGAYVFDLALEIGKVLGLKLKGQK